MGAGQGRAGQGRHPKVEMKGIPPESHTVHMRTTPTQKEEKKAGEGQDEDERESWRCRGETWNREGGGGHGN